MTHSHHASRARAAWPLIVLLLAHCVPALWRMSMPDEGSEAWDQNYHHAVLVARFAQTLDNPDISDYPSATSPGYHLLLAAAVWAGLVDGEELRTLYPWTDPSIPQAEMIRLSRIAQGMSQFSETGQRTIVEELRSEGAGGEELEWVIAEMELRGTPETARNLDARFGPVGLAFAASMRGDAESCLRDSSRFEAVLRPLRLMQLATSAAMLAVVWLVATRMGLSGFAAAAMALPAAWNPYVLGGGTWITTDCVAMLCAALAIGDSVSRAERGLPPGWVTVVAMVAAVLVRQSFLWVEGAVGAALLLPFIMGDRVRLRDAIPGVLAVVGPLVIVGWLVAQWGGLVPPAYRMRHGESFNPSAALMLCAVIAVWGGALAVQMRGDRIKAVAIVFVVACGLFLIPPSAYDPDAGRFGGFIWSLARLGPSWGDRSLVMVLLAALGVAAMALFGRSMRGRGHGRELLVLTMGLLTLGASLMVNPKSWERYAEVPVVILLPIIAAAAARGSKSNLQDRIAMSAVAPALLALLLSALMLFRPVLSQG